MLIYFGSLKGVVYWRGCILFFKYVNLNVVYYLLKIIEQFNISNNGFSIYNLMLYLDEKVDFIICLFRCLYFLCGDVYWKGELNYWNRSIYEDMLVI